MVVVTKEIQEICQEFEDVPELYEICMSGNLYEIARGLLDSEISNAARNPKLWAESAGWPTNYLTPSVEDCVDNEMHFTRRDVLDVMKALGEAVRELYEEGMSVDSALNEAEYSDEVSDTLNNIVAKRLKEAIDFCLS